MEAVHEITIDGYVASGPHDLVQVAGALSEGRMSPECLSSFVFADQAVAQIEAARDARVLFVRVGGPGGSVEGSFRIYEALRRFAASGGRVVTYALPGRVASTATTLLLAGDVRFMAPDADLLIHSVIAASGTELVDKGVCDEMNRRMLEVYTTRTTTPRAALEEALACTFDSDGVLQARRIPVDAALAFRWVTFALAEATARSMAEQLAAPGGLADVPAGAVGAREIRALSIEAGHIKSGEITADKIAAGQLRTSNYAEDANGNATAGAKLDHQGTALKVAPGGLKIGSYAADSMGFIAAMGRFRCWANGTFSWLQRAGFKADAPVRYTTGYSDNNPAVGIHIKTERSFRSEWPIMVLGEIEHLSGGAPWNVNEARAWMLLAEWDAARNSTLLYDVGLNVLDRQTWQWWEPNVLNAIINVAIVVRGGSWD